MAASIDIVVLAQAEERLRQESEIFDQKKAQDKKVFALRMAMGWTAVVLLLAICGFAGYIIGNHQSFATGTVTVATSALLVEALALVAAIWRGILGRGPTELAPTTELAPLSHAPQDVQRG